MKKELCRGAALIVAGLVAPACAQAEESGAEAARSIQFSALYKGDAIANVRGGLDRGVRLLGNAEAVAEADLDRLAGWGGARAKLHLLSVHGGSPNALAGTIQGVDNIEVVHDRAKIYEIWLEQSFANDRVSLLAGMADLNAEFYQTEAAGLLIAPAFGVGSELAATGPNGPSIFPSTALAARLRVTPSEHSYVKAAVFNAKAGVLGDRGGVDLHMRDGALAIGEVGVTAGGKLAVGYWRYTEKQPDIREVDSAGNSLRRTAQGVYVLGERHLAGTEDFGPQLSGFVRFGLSDANTTPYRGGWQAGLLTSGVVAGRPDSQLSFGVNRAYLSNKFRRNSAEAGAPLDRSETGFELTFQDKVASFLAVQPDIQYVIKPAVNPAVKDAVLVGLRLIVTASPN